MGWGVRQQDWPTKLNRFIASQSAVPFAWGERDCCLFVCDAIQSFTGSDPGERWRGMYSSFKGAQRLIQNNDGVSGLARIAFGDPIPSALAQRGDVVLVDTPKGEALAICVGDKMAAQGDAGIVFMPMTAAKAAWKI